MRISILNLAVIIAFLCGLPAYSQPQSGATYCESSSDGGSVTCGKLATYCESSNDGSAVACGKMATYCESSNDGSAVACGKMATYCESSSDGSAVACGGMGSEENDMETEGLARGLEALAVFGFLAVISLGVIWYRAHKRKAQHETLRLMIEKGHEVDQTLKDKLLR
jgi:hypothetical protein